MLLIQENEFSKRTIEYEVSLIPGGNWQFKNVKNETVEKNQFEIVLFTKEYRPILENWPVNFRVKS